MKNSNDTIENRTRDLPDCSAVPQPTAPPRAPHNILHTLKRKKTNWSDNIFLRDYPLKRVIDAKEE